MMATNYDQRIFNQQGTQQTLSIPFLPQNQPVINQLSNIFETYTYNIEGGQTIYFYKLKSVFIPFLKKFIW